MRENTCAATTSVCVCSGAHLSEGMGKRERELARGRELASNIICACSIIVRELDDSHACTSTACCSNRAYLLARTHEPAGKFDEIGLVR